MIQRKPEPRTKKHPRPSCLAPEILDRAKADGEARLQVIIDRELLELAAKAAGYDFEWGAQPLILATPPDTERPWRCWNPLTDDGDALRLAVDLGILEEAAWINYRNGAIFIEGLDARKATRRGITRAAAEIGRAMP